jgi:hypothetical protein
MTSAPPPPPPKKAQRRSRSDLPKTANRDRTLLSLFYREVAQQARFALRAADAMELGPTVVLDDSVPRDDIDALLELTQEAKDAFWSSVQSFLVASANVSKLIWGRWGDALRGPLGVRDDSPLKDRRLRNHFEHFDERLAKWADTDPMGVFIDTNTVGADDLKVAPTVHFQRNFDPDRYALTFQDEVYDLRPIIEELRRLHEAAVRASGGMAY